MTRYIVDASVIAECLVGTVLGHSVLEIVGNEEIAAPTLLDAEVLAALRKGVQQGHVDPADAERAIDNLIAWPIDRVPHRELLHRAWRYRHNVSAYDALYVALAAERDVPLLTADGRLARASGVDVVIQNVRLA